MGASFDIALLGATGFTGGLTADYLGAHLPDGSRWAIAGRNHDKLLAVARRIESAGGLRPALIDADTTDEASLAALAAQTRVLVTTVGPYLEHGMPVARAAAEAGIGYLDLTGEPAFVDQVWLELHDLAEATGARLIHSAGHDSIPYDLGVLYAVERLPEGVPIRAKGYVRATGRISGGTLASASGQVGAWREAKRLAHERRALQGRPVGRKVGGGGRLGRAPFGQAWAVPLPLIDPLHILRSARVLERYGPDFHYEHYAYVRHTWTLAASSVAVGGFLLASQLSVGRTLMNRLVMQRGSGPSEKARSKGWFSFDVIADGGGESVHARVSGGDPGYDVTSKLLAEAAMCVAFDDLPKVAGQVTTAQALGHTMIDRINGPVLRFEVL